MRDARPRCSPVRLAAVTLAATALAGCLGSLPGGDPAAVGDAGSPGTSSLDAVIVGTVALPGPHASEPSIAVAQDGTVVVAAPAGSAGPSNLAHGGHLWVSRDGGETFHHAVDATRFANRGGFCSCDTDVAAAEGNLYATTMLWTVNPAFTANLVRSNDQGRTWTLRHPSASTVQPIDRPWLSTSPDGTLFLGYARTATYTDLALAVAGQQGKSPSPVGTAYLQRSEDGGRTWSAPATVAEAGPDATYTVLDPVAPTPDRVLVPLAREARGSPNVAHVVAVSNDGGRTFDVTPLAGPLTHFARFGFSMDANKAGDAVAAWAGPAGGPETREIHVRSSADGGRAWSPPRKLDLPGNSVQPWVAVRSDGLTAVAHYGSGTAGPVPEAGSWRPRVALLPPSGGGPVLVNLTDEPTFHGVMCNFGTGCPATHSRTPMREFLSAAWGPDGDLFVAWADAREKRKGDSRLTVTRIAIQGSATP